MTSDYCLFHFNITVQFSICFSFRLLLSPSMELYNFPHKGLGFLILMLDNSSCCFWYHLQLLCAICIYVIYIYIDRYNLHPYKNYIYIYNIFYPAPLSNSFYLPYICWLLRLSRYTIILIASKDNFTSSFPVSTCLLSS